MKCSQGHRKAKGKPCKYCHRISVLKNQRTERGCIQHRFRCMKNRIETKGWPEPDFDKEWFMEWASNDPDFLMQYTIWKDSGYKDKESPSLDRIDPEKTYLKSNIRWLSDYENWLKGNTEQKRTSPKENVPMY
jgi:hypothetical protein